MLEMFKIDDNICEQKKGSHGSKLEVISMT